MVEINLPCIPIELEQIRARIVINSSLNIDTPYVKSFNVNKSRSSNIGTFSASVEVPSNTNFGSPTGTSGRIEIFAGTKDVYLTKGAIFTGRIRTISPQPAPGKPNYFIVSIQGDDVMSKLQNKRFSRRLATDGPGLFVTINGSVTQRPTSMVWSVDKRVRAGKSTVSSTKPHLSDKDEHNSVTRHNDNSSNSAWITRDGVEPTAEPTGGQGSGGLGIHDHSTINAGGAAFGVYSVS